MNERIENLAQGCFEYFEGTLDGDIVEFDYKKFAELIVQECQTVVEWAISVDSTIDRVPVLIKEHFGVEE
jgi:hypothetical protein